MQQVAFALHMTGCMSGWVLPCRWTPWISNIRESLCCADSWLLEALASMTRIWTDKALVSIEVSQCFEQMLECVIR